MAPSIRTRALVFLGALPALACGNVEGPRPVRWVQRFENATITSVAGKPEGGAVVAGSLSETDFGPRSFLASLDARGNVEWQRELPGGRGFTQRLPQVALGPNGAIALATHDGDDCFENCVRLRLFDEDGGPRWDRAVQGDGRAGDVGLAFAEDEIVITNYVETYGPALAVYGTGAGNGLSTVITRYTLAGDFVRPPFVLRGTNLDWATYTADGTPLLSGKVPSLPDWLDPIEPGVTADSGTRCGATLALGDDDRPIWWRAACAEVSYSLRVTAAGNVAAVGEIGSTGEHRVALLESASGSARWTAPLSVFKGLLITPDGGVDAIGPAFFQLDAQGRAIRQWPGQLSEGGYQARENPGGFCQPQLAQSAEGVFVSTDACETARAVLGAHLPDDFAGALVAHVDPEAVPDYEPSCGNGWLDPGEECDTAPPGNVSCPTAGVVTCSKGCKADLGGCE